MKNMEKQCRLVSYDSVNFGSEVMSCLQSDRVFAIIDLPNSLESAIKNLFESSDDFFDHYHEYPESDFPPHVEEQNTSGLFNPRKNSSLQCYNAVRFFIAMNKEGEINNKKMPLYKGKPVMSEAAKLFHQDTESLITRILDAIEHSLEIVPSSLKKAILGNAVVALMRYFPLTQDRAMHLFEERALSVSGDKIVQFGLHRDFSPLTILAYRDSPRGLYVEDLPSKTQVPLTVNNQNKPYVIVFTGTELKELTNGHVRAIRHLVLTSPQEQRQEADGHSHQRRSTVSKFTYCSLDVGPLQTIHGSQIEPPKPRKHFRSYPIPKATFFDAHIAAEAERNALLKAVEFPRDIVTQYPITVQDSEAMTAQLSLADSTKNKDSAQEIQYDMRK